MYKRQITSWVYDARGRLVQESKYVNGTGGGTFVTQWGYDLSLIHISEPTRPY